MSKKIALYGMLIALAFVLNYIENILSFASLTYGIKLGLANVVVLAAFYMLGYKGAFAISVVRIILAGLTFGNVFSMVYSLAGERKGQTADQIRTRAAFRQKRHTHHGRSDVHPGFDPGLPDTWFSGHAAGTL